MDDKVANLQMLQSVISRMALNSANSKNLCMTIVAALLALAVGQKQVDFVFISFVLIMLFWALDAMYLRLERGFRARFNIERVSGVKPEFNISPSYEGVNSFAYTLFSWSVFPYYLVMCIVLVVVICIVCLE